MKRFYTAVETESRDGGFALMLDGRPVKTPARRLLLAPSAALAEALAAEWRAQDKTIAPATMPLTRLANTAVDRMADERPAIVAGIAAYGGSDLLCYMAAAPRELTDRQMAEWQPWLDWAGRRYGVCLKAATGVMPQAQMPEDLAALEAAVAGADDWELTALSECVPLTGSLVLGLAILDGVLDEAEAWRLSQIDDDFQASHWGRDAEAEERRAAQRADLATAVRFLSLSRG